MSKDLNTEINTLINTLKDVNSSAAKVKLETENKEKDLTKLNKQIEELSGEVEQKQAALRGLDLQQENTEIRSQELDEREYALGVREAASAEKIEEDSREAYATIQILQEKIAGFQDKLEKSEKECNKVVKRNQERIDEYDIQEQAVNAGFDVLRSKLGHAEEEVLAIEGKIEEKKRELEDNEKKLERAVKENESMKNSLTEREETVIAKEKDLAVVIERVKEKYFKSFKEDLTI